MKRAFPPLYLGLILMLACVIYRLLASRFPGFLSNISPLMAVAFVGSMYLPRRWGWLVGPATLLFTEAAFLRTNYLTDGSGQWISLGTVASLVLFGCLYASAGALGIYITRFRSLPLIVTGSLVCSLLFYIAANTFSWGWDIVVGLPTSYAPTLAGWWQANTVGLPGYLPTWVFLRNAMAGDLFFALVLLLVLDRSLFFGHTLARSPASSRAI